jgi:hypothetical protein
MMNEIMELFREFKLILIRGFTFSDSIGSSSWRIDAWQKNR